jgi:hypothetical protein
VSSKKGQSKLSRKFQACLFHSRSTPAWLWLIGVILFQCDDYEWPCGNCSRRSEHHLCSHPKSSQDPIENLARRAQHLGGQLRKKEKTCRKMRRQMEESDRSSTLQVEKLRREKRTLTHKVDELQKSNDALQKREQYLQHELQCTVETSRVPTYPIGQEQGFVSGSHHIPIHQSTEGGTLTKYGKQLPQADFDVDYDKDDPLWTPLGVFESWPMADPNLQRDLIDEEPYRDSNLIHLADQPMLSSNATFDVMAPLIGVEVIHPLLSVHLVAGDVWNTVQTGENQSTILSDRRTLPHQEHCIHCATDQDLEQAANSLLYSINLDLSNPQSTGSQSVAILNSLDIS